MPLAAIALAVLVAPAVGGAKPHTASALRADDAALAAKSRAAVLGLYSLDQRLAAGRATVAALDGRSRSLRTEQRSLRARLAIAESSARAAQRQLAAQLRTLYEQGKLEPLDIVFGARSLDEAMTGIDNLAQSAGRGKDVLREVQATKQTLLTERTALAAKAAALARATADAEAAADALLRARAARASYISSLAARRRLDRQEIARLVTRARVAQARSTRLAHVRGAGRAPAPAGRRSAGADPTIAEPAAGTELTVSATGYSLPGTTATGLPVGWGVAAVDPSVIPLGTHFTVPGYGEAVAADIGSGVSGTRIDLWFPTVGKARAWGRRTVTIVLH